MINHGQSDVGTKINVSGTSNYILIFPDTILTGTISVRRPDGGTLWQKIHCTSDDIVYAIVIAKNNVQTNVFETH